MKLTEYLDIIAYDIGFWMAAFQNPDYPLDQLGDVSIDVTGKLRTAAIIALVGKGDSDAYHHNLIRSAGCRIAYLGRLREAGVSDAHHQASGRVGPLLDAIAAADFTRARQIVALSPRNWLQGHEYEDDFCYAQLLHLLLSVPLDTDRLQQLFLRYEGVLDGQEDPRLDVMKALVERDQAGFDAAFEALLVSRTAAIEADKARKRIEEPTMIAERQVYVEGLALLQIATRLKIATESEYIYCPSSARVPMQAPFPGE